jgi:ComF family protein
MRGIIVSAYYENPLLQKSIHTLKYNFVKDLTQPLSKILMKGFETWQQNHQENIKNIILLPIPLHKKREKHRGFNQAELLAQSLGKKLGAKVNTQSIVRERNTSAQANLDSLKRRKNIKNAFKIKNATLFKNKMIFIIDDVCTTSSTLEECAKEIAKADPKEIWGLVLARGK